MKDPVALAWSGRIQEALSAALKQMHSEESELANQALEAISILGSEYQLRSNPEIDSALVSASQRKELERKLLEAAAAVDSASLDDKIEHLLEHGPQTWPLLRHVGERPSLRFARSLSAGWAQIPDSLQDLALLTSCVLPVANPQEAQDFGEKALAARRSSKASVRAASFFAIGIWQPSGSLEALKEGLDDEEHEVREAAKEALERL